MKKLLCIFLALILVFPLQACKKEDSTPAPSESSPESTASTTVPKETAAETVPESTATFTEETTAETTAESTAKLPEETVAETTTAAEDAVPEITCSAERIDRDGFSFEDLNCTAFEFSSGAGAWRTVLRIHRDGFFSGEYHDSNMGETGEGYPRGSVYCSSFTGRFSQPVMVDENTYSIRLEQISYRRQPGTEEIRDDIFYHYTEAYGLYGSEEFLIYLPGTPLDTLPEHFLYWTMLFRDETELPFYGLYAPETEKGFSSYNTVSWIRTQVSIREDSDRSFETSLQEAVTQAEINTLSANRYQMWDDILNELWAILIQALDKETMSRLTAEELAWIAQKEQAIADAGAEYTDGSLYPAVTAGVAAIMTKERVYELLEYLP